MKAILTDITKCIGCLECVTACKNVHNLGIDVPRKWHQYDGLSAKNWTSIIQRPGPHYVRKQCRHCLEPACVSACPVGALHTTESGAVAYDTGKCIGCRYCMIACPYGIPRYDWEKAIPYVEKCNLCYDERLIKGKQPACTEACPTKATIFGERNELLQEAHRRIKSDPGKYIQKVYGEHEVGGTAVLYISDISLDFLSKPMRPGTMALPKTTALAMHAVPFTFVGVGAVMGGLYWIIRRRQQLSTMNGKKEENQS